MRRPDKEVLRKVAQWLAYADEDLGLARHGLKMGNNAPYRLIAYHAQQCAEKHLKAYLVYHGIDFPYTHSISRLLELCGDKANWIGELRGAEELTPFAITTRYPGEDEEVTKEEALQAIEIAAKVRDIIRNALTEEGMDVPAQPKE